MEGLNKSQRYAQRMDQAQTYLSKGKFEKAYDIFAYQVRHRITEALEKLCLQLVDMGLREKKFSHVARIFVYLIGNASEDTRRDLQIAFLTWAQSTKIEDSPYDETSDELATPEATPEYTVELPHFCVQLIDASVEIGKSDEVAQFLLYCEDRSGPGKFHPLDPFTVLITELALAQQRYHDQAFALLRQCEAIHGDGQFNEALQQIAMLAAQQHHQVGLHQAGIAISTCLAECGCEAAIQETDEIQSFVETSHQTWENHRVDATQPWNGEITGSTNASPGMLLCFPDGLVISGAVNTGTETYPEATYVKSDRWGLLNVYQYR